MNTLVLDHLHLVRAVARELRLDLTPCPTASVDRDDYLAAGAEALVRAGGTWRPDAGSPFAAYAWAAITWAMRYERRNLRWRRQGERPAGPPSRLSTPLDYAAARNTQRLSPTGAAVPANLQLQRHEGSWPPGGVVLARLIHSSAVRPYGAGFGGDRSIQPSGCRMERSQFPRTSGAPPPSAAIPFQLCRRQAQTKRHARSSTKRHTPLGPLRRSVRDVP